MAVWLSILCIRNNIAHPRINGPRHTDRTLAIHFPCPGTRTVFPFPSSGPKSALSSRRLTRSRGWRLLLPCLRSAARSRALAEAAAARRSGRAKTTAQTLRLPGLNLAQLHAVARSGLHSQPSQLTGLVATHSFQPCAPSPGMTVWTFRSAPAPCRITSITLKL
jgi:hypothetical protein